jgi:hypothetical protein
MRVDLSKCVLGPLGRRWSRRYLLNHPVDSVGLQYHAVIRPMSRRHLDANSLAIEIGEELLSAFLLSA